MKGGPPRPLTPGGVLAGEGTSSWADRGAEDGDGDEVSGSADGRAEGEEGDEVMVKASMTDGERQACGRGEGFMVISKGFRLCSGSDENWTYIVVGLSWLILQLVLHGMRDGLAGCPASPVS